MEETINNLKSLKLKTYPGQNVTDWRDAILGDAERLESSGAFQPEHLVYTTCIHEITSDSQFYLWEIQKYKKIINLIKKRCVCDLIDIQPEELIKY